MGLHSSPRRPTPGFRTQLSALHAGGARACANVVTRPPGAIQASPSKAQAARPQQPRCCAPHSTLSHAPQRQPPIHPGLPAAKTRVQPQSGNGGRCGPKPRGLANSRRRGITCLAPPGGPPPNGHHPPSNQQLPCGLRGTLAECARLGRKAISVGTEGLRYTAPSVASSMGLGEEQAAALHASSRGAEQGSHNQKSLARRQLQAPLHLPQRVQGHGHRSHVPAHVHPPASRQLRPAPPPGPRLTQPQPPKGLPTRLHHCAQHSTPYCHAATARPWLALPAHLHMEGVVKCKSAAFAAMGCRPPGEK